MNPIKNEIGGVFIPVSDIEKARDWYCDLLGLPADGELYFGHIYVVPMTGPDLVLDSKIYRSEDVYKVPAFQFRTDDIHKAYDYMVSRGVEVVTDVEHEQWFNFKDPDGNLFMVCK